MDGSNLFLKRKKTKKALQEYFFKWEVTYIRKTKPNKNLKRIMDKSYELNSSTKIFQIYRAATCVVDRYQLSYFKWNTLYFIGSLESLFKLTLCPNSQQFSRYFDFCVKFDVYGALGNAEYLS